MKRLLLLLALLPTVSAQTSSSADYLQQITQFRTQRAKGLTAPEGWFSLVALHWLQPGDTTVGSASGNALRLEHVPAHLAIFHLANNAVTLAAPSGGFPAGTTVDGKPAAPVTLSYDDHHPSQLRNSGVLIIVIKRGDRLYLRVKDAQSPDRTAFHGLSWYPPEQRFVVTAKWTPNNPPRTLSMPNIIGLVERDPSPGVAEFTLDGQALRLEPVIEYPADKRRFFVFRDTTSKTTTYGAGRFLYTQYPSNGLDKPGTVVLDFNRTQNPPCAYTAYATCPLPAPENRLNIAIPAGEKRYHE